MLSWSCSTLSTPPWKSYQLTSNIHANCQACGSDRLTLFYSCCSYVCFEKCHQTGQNKDVQNHIHSKSTSRLVDSINKYAIIGRTSLHRRGVFILSTKIINTVKHDSKAGAWWLNGCSCVVTERSCGHDSGCYCLKVSKKKSNILLKIGRHFKCTTTWTLFEQTVQVYSALIVSIIGGASIKYLNNITKAFINLMWASAAFTKITR